MGISTFIDTYREAFGQQAGLPIAFWYSDHEEAPAEKINGCLFKCISRVREGHTVSLSRETMTCGGGKLYTGFDGMPERDGELPVSGEYTDVNVYSILSDEVNAWTD